MSYVPRRSAHVQPDKPLGSWRLEGCTDGLEELVAALQRQILLSGKGAMLAAEAAGEARHGAKGEVSRTKCNAKCNVRVPGRLPVAVNH
jgi:hypothetical protein